MKLGVVGAGIAGVAAVWRAVELGVRVSWLSRGTGATALTSGAVDYRLWYESGAQAEGIAEPVMAFGRRFWTFPERPAQVVTTSGLLRPTLGHDPLILDLETAKAGTIVVVGRSSLVTHMATQLTASRWARASKTEFTPLKLRHAGLRRLEDALLDASTEELNEVLEGLRAAADPKAKGWLLPPGWLRSERQRRDFEAQLGAPVGTTLSDAGGFYGQRLQQRIEAETSTGVERLDVFVSKIEALRSGWRLHFQTADGQPSHCDVEACLLAMGGVVSGGVTLDALGQLKLNVGTALKFEFRAGTAPVSFPTAAPQGVDFCLLGAEATAQLGLNTAEGGGLAAALAAAGECRSGVPRTLLGAVHSAINAVDKLLAV